MGRPFLASIPHTSRSFYHLRWRLIFVLFIVAFFEQQRLFFIYRQSLSAKYSPTQFATTSEEPHVQLLRPDDEGAQFQYELIAHRGHWKVLGEGWEGKVYAYENSVIKTFTPGRSPFRNCVSATARERWPTEIAASLRFGGFIDHQDSKLTVTSDHFDSTLDGFLPVKAYFKAPASSSIIPEWHLVTPLVKGGNLDTLARNSAADLNLKTFSDADERYRPAFEGLLSSLQHLHEAGFCHDDIKPANIFVQNETRWLLGDLGNLRHISHPYHSSQLWVENDQLEDCRANDVVRALKTYLKFIQTATNDKDNFNKAIFEGEVPLSRLFWNASANASTMTAARLRERSLIEVATQAPVYDVNYDMRHLRPKSLLYIFNRRWELQRAVDDLIKTRMGEKLARLWAMTWVFGVPISELCGV